jgi:cyclic dehypoxanthinyl futalosine synthase
MLEEIKQKVAERLPITRQEASFLFLEASDETLSQLATDVKLRYHSADVATYLIMAIINYTNVCVAMCDYCSFYRLPHQSGTYTLSAEQIFEKIEDLRNLGGNFVGFNGGFHPKLGIPHYAELFSQIRNRYGNDLEFYGMTVAEFIFASKVAKMPYAEAAQMLVNKGSRWVTGGGAEILDNDFRKRHSPRKYTAEEYYKAQGALLEAGLGSTATMVIGFDETLEERLNHLESLREFQDKAPRPLTSFLCWTYKPYNNKLGGAEISTREYLRWLAISRIYLHNFEHIRTSVLTKNEDALLGLRFGANDFDLPTDDEVTLKAGAKISLEFEKILETARNLGYRTVLREAFPVPASR